MDHGAHDLVAPDIQPPTSLAMQMNGVHSEEISEPSFEDIEKELPVVYDGQIPLGDLISRVVQSIYAELSEQAETSVSPSVYLITQPQLCFV